MPRRRKLQVAEEENDDVRDKRQKNDSDNVEVVACQIIVEVEKHPFKGLYQDYISVPIILDRNKDLSKDDVILNCNFKLFKRL